MQGASWGVPQGRTQGPELLPGPGPLQVLQSFSNIEDDCTVCPSWNLTLRARGHSYAAALEHHVPQYSMDVPKVRVAPAAVGVGLGSMASAAACRSLFPL